MNAYTPEVQNDLEIRTSECPIAFHQIGGKCYFYGYFKLNWFRAMEFCHSFGQSVSLACLETKDENEQLKAQKNRINDDLQRLMAKRGDIESL